MDIKMNAFINATFALNYVVAPVLRCARTFLYAYALPLLAPRISLRKRVSKSVHVLVMLVLVLGVSACKPRSVLMASTPEGPPEYRQGWKDGCETGLASYGNKFYKTFYSFKMDPDLRKNELYNRTWTDAYNYCRHFTKGNLAQGFYPGGGGYNPGSDNIYEDLRDLRTTKMNDGFAIPIFQGIQLYNLQDDGPANNWDGEDDDDD